MGLYPTMDLRLDVPGLGLRLMADDELARLATRAVGRILPASQQHFLAGGWSQLPSPRFERGMLAHHWRNRARVAPHDWVLAFGVFPSDDDGPVGVQSLRARDFPSEGVVSTGSWLVDTHQGRGLGTLMRAMVLEFAFTHLGARAATTSAHPDNRSSQRVSERVGYRISGHGWDDLPGGPQPRIRYRLEAADWRRRPALRVSGLADCLAMLGAAPDDEPTLPLHRPAPADRRRHGADQPTLPAI